MRRVIIIVSCLILLSIQSAIFPSLVKAGTNAETQELVTCWNEMLAGADESFGNIIWALDYVDAWTSSHEWNDLFKARMACNSICSWIENYEYPVMSLSRETLLVLMEEGVETDVLGDYSLPETISKKVLDHLKNNIYLSLEGLWEYKSDCDFISDMSDVLREIVDYCCQELILETNYLMLSLPEDGKVLWEEMKTTHTVVFSGDPVWNPDKGSLERENLARVNSSTPFDKLGSLLVSQISAGKNYIYDLETGKHPELIEIADMPMLIFSPEWYDPYSAQFFFRKNTVADESIESISCGDELTTEGYNEIIQCPHVSLAEVKEYMKLVMDYVKSFDKEDNTWILDMENYYIYLTWNENEVSVLFKGECCTFSTVYGL